MENFRIVVGNDIYTYVNSDSIMTTLYVDNQGECFPDCQWTDLTKAVLGIWLYNLLEIKYLSNTKAKLYFMDGPFYMTIFKDEDMQLTIDCINARGRMEVIEFTFNCSYKEMMSSMLNAFKSFNKLLFSNGMHTGRFEPTYRRNMLSMNEIKDALSKL